MIGRGMQSRVVGIAVGQRRALPFREIFCSLPTLTSVEFSVRRLPHWQPPDSEFFVTWRLYGSLPEEAHGAAPQALAQSRSAGEAFVALDRKLDCASTGPLWLKDAHVAEHVSRVLLSGMSEWGLYGLFAWVVMANHVQSFCDPSAAQQGPDEHQECECAGG
jgi:hypothetical protein